MQGDQHELADLPGGETLLERGLTLGAFGHHPFEGRALVQLEPDPQRHDQQEEREQEGDAPAPFVESLGPHDSAGDQDDAQRHDQADRGRRLDPAGQEAALLCGRMFGHIDGGPAVLSAQGKTLRDPEEDQEDWRRDADLAKVRQKADRDGGDAHHGDGDQEGGLASCLVAEPAEHQGPQGPHDEADTKGQQG